MNENNLQQIFRNYIDKFQVTNGTDHREFYKWLIIKRFRQVMDEALNAPTEEFSKKLYAAKKLSANLIDNYTQPFYGMVKFAEKEPEFVRDMFLKLYEDDNGDLKKRQVRVREFLELSHQLREKYYPGSYLYKNDMHSVTGYLFLYDPDHNFIFKATHALAFADCIEFYDDWSYGDTVKLPVYYRMCNKLVEQIKASPELLDADAGRVAYAENAGADAFYPDPEKHILAFDVIYCCSTYGLFEGIPFERPNTKDRQVILERKEKAAKLQQDLLDAEEEQKKLDEAIAFIQEAFQPGTIVTHKRFGEGTIVEANEKNITVEFAKAGKKLLGLLASVTSGQLSVETEGFAEKVQENLDLLKHGDGIRSKVRFAEKVLEPFTDYLG